MFPHRVWRLFDAQEVREAFARFDRGYSCRHPAKRGSLHYISSDRLLTDVIGVYQR